MYPVSGGVELTLVFCEGESAPPPPIGGMNVNYCVTNKMNMTKKPFFSTCSSFFLAGLAAVLLAAADSSAQTRLLTLGDNDSPRIAFTDGADTLWAPSEGLWSVALGWENDWMTDWRHVKPSSIEKEGKWTVAKGAVDLGDGNILACTDSYVGTDDGLVKCIRRFEWKGGKTLRNVTLSVRLQEKGTGLSLVAPGIVYYGNRNGAAVNPEAVAVWEGKEGEFAIFEEHRYPMPFVMLENPAKLHSCALHVTPSPVRGGILSDQWWSLGVEAKASVTEFVMYSGPIGYNGRRSVAKALQKSPMSYKDTWINLAPGQVVEKEFYVDVYSIEAPGSGFQKPLYTSIDLHKPYDADRFDSFRSIVASKLNYAESRWVESGNAVGYGMYDPRTERRQLVMGWCGQADSPGYFHQVLSDWEKSQPEGLVRIGREETRKKVQSLMDFLTTYPFTADGLFNVRYDIKAGLFKDGDPVSCGQAMYNFAKAIEYARKNGGYDVSGWEKFLKKACDGASDRILSKQWNPVSTAEAFYIAPLAISSELFGSDRYEKAARKAAGLFARRHHTMAEGCYWGGTLDATCEDKEGAWAAFQGFLECYERFNDSKFLSWAKHAMDVCLSYTVVWDIPLPAGRLADHSFKSTGWTVVSAQNQHIDVYGVLFAPEICRMGKYLGDDRLVRLSKVMYRSCSQLTDPYGSQGEQLQHTNFAQRGDMSDVYKLRGGYSESWTVFWITAHFLNSAARFIELGVEP